MASRDVRCECDARVAILRNDAGDTNGVGDALEVQLASVDVADSLDRTSQMGDLPAREDLAGRRHCAQPRREVQRTAAIPAFHWYGLPGVEADPDRQRKRGVVPGFLGESLLEIQGRPDRLSWGREDGESLVASKFDDAATTGPDSLSGQSGELCRQPSRSLVATRLGEGRITADVGDHECLDPLGSVQPVCHRLTSGDSQGRSLIIRGGD